MDDTQPKHPLTVDISAPLHCIIVIEMRSNQEPEAGGKEAYNVDSSLSLSSFSAQRNQMHRRQKILKIWTSKCMRNIRRIKSTEAVENPVYLFLRGSEMVVGQVTQKQNKATRWNPSISDVTLESRQARRRREQSPQ